MPTTQSEWAHGPIRAQSAPMRGTAPGTSQTPVFDLISRDELQRLSQDQGLTDAEIAHMFNVSTNQVHRRRQQMNLIQGQRTADRLAYIVQLSEMVKQLPDDAISEIEAIVSRYTDSAIH